MASRYLQSPSWMSWTLLQPTISSQHVLQTANVKADFGGHRDPNSTSGLTLLAAVVPSTLIAITYLTLFVVIRPWYRKIYAPRTFLETIPKVNRTPIGTAGRLEFFKKYCFRLGDEFVLQHSSLDAYLFLRFLRLIVTICILGTCITWPILLPANCSGRGDSTQLDRFSFSNINRNDILWAHVVVACVFFSLVTAAIIRERLRLIGARQAMQLDGATSSELSPRTVLFLNVPAECLDVADLHETFGDDAIKSWPVPRLDKLDGLVEERRNIALQLEAAQVELSRTAVEARSRRSKASMDHDSTNLEVDALVPRSSRPRHRLQKGVGHKVDTIDWARDTFEDVSQQIRDLQSSTHSRFIPNGQTAVFVSFSTQAAAHDAYKNVSFSNLPIGHRYIDVLPNEALWHNLSRSSAERASKALFALVFVIAFTIFFSIPAGLIGTISNVSYLAENVKGLHFITHMPDVVFALLQGLLPPFLVSWFVSYVPKLFRHIAELSGEPTKAQVELKTQAWFFVFSVIQVFLITTFSSGAAAVVYKIIKDPTNAPDLLAQSVPTAANFYLSYFLLQGTVSTADAILNYSDLLEYLFRGRFWTRTPREKYELEIDMKGIAYGKLYPKFTNFLVIALVYACIAPLVIGFAAVGLTLYYFCYKYQFLYVCTSKIDSRGAMYARALKQMTTGVYLAELCLLGLFGARRGVAQTATIVALLICTAVVNAVADHMLRPLELYLAVDDESDESDGSEVDSHAANDTSSSDPEAQNLLSSHNNRGRGRHTDESGPDSSHRRRLGLHWLPERLARPISDAAESIISSSRGQIRAWLHQGRIQAQTLDRSSRDREYDGTRDRHVHASYPSSSHDARHDTDPVSSDGSSEADIENAYAHPSLRARSPIVWLARDRVGVSQAEMEENEKHGIETRDSGAWIDGVGQVGWSRDDFGQIPIFKKI